MRVVGKLENNIERMAIIQTHKAEGTENWRQHGRTHQLNSATLLIKHHLIISLQGGIIKLNVVCHSSLVTGIWGMKFWRVFILLERKCNCGRGDPSWLTDLKTKKDNQWVSIRASEWKVPSTAEESRQLITTFISDICGWKEEAVRHNRIKWHFCKIREN